MGQNQHIVASHEGHVRHAILPHFLRNTLHVETVGENQTLETHLFLQQVSDHAVRQRRGSVLHLLNGGEIQMTHHRAICTLLNHIAEWRKFDIAHLFHRTRHRGQGEMRVGGGIAVTWKVFHRGYQAFTLHALGVGRGFLAHFLRVLTKAAHPDDGIGRIGVDIGHRSEIHMDAHALALLGHLLTHLVNQLVILDGPQGHLIRIRQGLVHAHGKPPFSIDGDHQRGLRHGLPFVGLLHLRIGIATEETHTTDVVPFDVLRHILIKRFVGQVGTHANQLPHTLLHSKTVVHRIHPARLSILGKALCDRKSQHKAS